MAEFTFDTSGVVIIEAPAGRAFSPSGATLAEVYWDKLPPFEQGYIEAALREFATRPQVPRDEPRILSSINGKPQKISVRLESGRYSSRAPRWMWGAWHIRDNNGWMTLEREPRRSDGGWTYFSAYPRNFYGFRHLAPETLVAMLKDCALYQSYLTGEHSPDRLRRMGECLWYTRQDGDMFLDMEWGPDCAALTQCARVFPPLTLYLSDDGKVRQREGA